jgi:hypothetical protein
VIQVSEPYQDFASRSGPARSRATSLLRISGPNGARFELLVGPATNGGECMVASAMSVKHFIDRRHAGGFLQAATGRDGPAPALQLSSQFQPPRLLSGRVRSDVQKLRIRFPDGLATTLTPTRSYILWAAQEDHLDKGTGAVGAEGLGADGTVIPRQSPKPPTR